jgi:hypothetical protein
MFSGSPTCCPGYPNCDGWLQACDYQLKSAVTSSSVLSLAFVRSQLQ